MADEDEAPEEATDATAAEADAADDGLQVATGDDDLQVATSDDDLQIVTDDDSAAAEAPETIGAALSPADIVDGDGPLDAVYDISVDVTAVLGTATMRVSQLLKMGRGAVVQLDRMVDEEVDLRCKGLLIARGDVVVVNENLGVTLTKIIKTNIAKV